MIRDGPLSVQEHVRLKSGKAALRDLGGHTSILSMVKVAHRLRGIEHLHFKVVVVRSSYRGWRVRIVAKGIIVYHLLSVLR